MSSPNLSIANGANGSNPQPGSKSSPKWPWVPGHVVRARLSDGSFAGETPASRDSQWVSTITRRIPNSDFGMKAEKTDELVSAAHAAAATQQPVSDIQRRGRLMFDAVWADERGRIEGRRDAARRELDRTEDDRAILKRNRDVTPRMLEERDGRLSAPSGWGFVGFLAVAALLVVVLGCEWLSAATLRKFELQSLFTALLVTSPLIAFALSTKLLFRRDPPPVMRNLQIVFHVVGAVAGCVWFILLATNYGTALREDFELPTKAATIGFTFAQFLAGLVGSAWLTLLLASMLQPGVTVRSNPDWEKMTQEIRKLDHESNRWMLVVRREEAELAGFSASRDSWIAKGEEAYARSRLALALIEERMRLILNP